MGWGISRGTRLGHSFDYGLSFIHLYSDQARRLGATRMVAPGEGLVVDTAQDPAPPSLTLSRNPLPDMTPFVYILSGFHKHDPAISSCNVEATRDDESP